MIPRYTLPETGRVWSEENKLTAWLRVELAVIEAEAEEGIIPGKVAARIRSRFGALGEKRGEKRVDADRPRAEKSAEWRRTLDLGAIAEIEEKVKHDVIAFTSDVARRLGPDGRYLHFGLTSSDILDTALALQIEEASQILDQRFKTLLAALAKKARRYQNTLMVGRTHGVHAEPITFGLKLAGYYGEVRRAHERFQNARDHLRYGKLSGAVGTFAHLPPSVEARVMRRLGLRPEPLATQIIQRDRHAEFLSGVAIGGGTLERLAIEFRGLQRTEIREVEENFAKGQKGSSAMPHKKNPIASERITGAARLLRGYALSAFENIALWHERDISHSSVERVIFPDATILLDFMLKEMTDLVEGLVVNAGRMRENLEESRGLVFSQALLLALIQKGLTREKAYGLVQQAAERVWKNGLPLKEVVLNDQRITSRLSPDEIKNLFDYRRHTRHVRELFRRVGIKSA